MSLLIPTGEILMKWNESNASVRKNFSVGKLLFPLVLIVVIFVGIAAFKFWAGTQIQFPIQILLVLPIILLGFSLSWFSSGAEVHLTELCVVRAAGRYGSRTDYGEIENCTIRTDNYDGKKISTVEIELKDKSKFRINSPVEKFIVPEDVNSDQVLQILRDKGVNVIETP
jgi:hypothetical protein